LEEERRLMYVSMTRAERYLYLSSANYRRGQYNPPSRFLTEIEDNIQK
jgi:DNA helicase-2/ATP-dependent DNA helicase PcrA